MKYSLIFGSLLIVLVSCNPYKGFSGVDPKGMGKKPPSVRIADDMQKSQKKSNRRAKREMKRKRKLYGAPTK
tara:strand:+ start:557 stop:772 length:216 start_codon:yes stop_codon:yes gene_type:complete